jgi:hypothetical protein
MVVFCSLLLAALVEVAYFLKRKFRCQTHHAA